MNPSVLSDPRAEARAFVRRSVFGTFAVACAIGGVLVGSNAGTPLAARVPIAIGFGLIALFCAAASRWHGERGEWALVATCCAALALVAGTSIGNGWGINTPAVGFCTVFTFLVGATMRVRLGLMVALASATTLLGLGWAEHTGQIRGVLALGDMSHARRLVNQFFLLAIGLAGGLVVTRVFDHYLGVSRDRELRFHDLLGIAADSYWEMDHDYVVTAVWRRDGAQRFRAMPQPLRRPWELPDMLYDDDALDAHRADLEARRPFRDLHVRWRRADGSVRHELVSGEPRFDAAGRFLGYWGVSRDISDRIAAAEALRRSEAMFSHLVTTSPDLITLTDLDSGRYVMVNEAFTRFSGFSAAEATGRTSLELGVWGDLQAREDFVRRIRADGMVKDLPLTFVAKSGRRFSLLVSGATFEMEGGRYLVLNGRDVTDSERTRVAHEAVLQNASLGIAFVRDGLFVQANPALEKMLGWPRGTLVGQRGRTAILASDADYAAIETRIAPLLARGEPVEFVRELTRHDGSVFWCRLMAKAVDPRHAMGGGTIWIVEDITERRRFEQALAKARDDAEAASRAKSAFLANTSHEIRTPLNGLVGMARLARRPDLDEGRRRQYLDQIVESAETLTAVISDVLDLSKIEAGKLDLEQVPFDLHALLDSLCHVYTTLADARGLGFALHVDARVPPWVCGDPVRVRQILANFLSNALKFTAHGEVSLHAVACGGAMLRFEVRDTGSGIPPDVQARLFQPFTQADQSTTRRFGGSGLGLSICLELATRMQGRVGVESMPGEGSCFWAELTLPDVPAHDDPSGFGALEGALAGTRVLMVEDNAVNMTIAVAMLEQWGVQVTQAGDGAQALAAVEQAAHAGQPFDLVLMDVQMPVLSGYEATRRLRARPERRPLPIIALTAAALTSEREQALACGMNGFLTKPIDARRLHDTLATTLARSRAAA